MDFTDIIIAGKVNEIDTNTLSLEDINILTQQIYKYNEMIRLVGNYLETRLQSKDK